MLFTLKEHQVDAVAEILDRLRLAKKHYHEDGVLTQFALSATTSAGKTVICAAVVEALFFGSEEFNVEPDPGATVLWFSDDPALNIQSMARFNQASEKLGVGRTRIIEPGFAAPVLEPNTVYFLNAQKLRDGARLVRGNTAAAGGDQDALPAPDMVQQTIYDVLRNTVEAPGRTLYFIIDEAHRGMKPVKDRKTIVQRIINGEGGAPPMPVVFGISATVERFTAAMKGVTGRTSAENVTVDARKVMESGLLKETVQLSLPCEVGDFDTKMLAEAVQTVKQYEADWDEYTSTQGLERVLPLMVVQVPDKVDEEYLSRVLHVLTEEWDAVRGDGIAHVFGEHQDLQIGMRTIPYVEPHRVQDSKWVRVLLAKEAISTGWDCPRAEVLVSFRAKNDRTAVHQLFGRMMRPPLARRITGHGTLNSVKCFVPRFDQRAATQIAEMLSKGETTPGAVVEGTGQRVLIDPVTVVPNPRLPEAVTGVFETLPTYTIPSGQKSPMKRLDRLSAALTQDFPGTNVSNESTDYLVAALRGAAARYVDEVAAAKADVLTMDAQRITAHVGQEGVHVETYERPADARAINDAYRSAALVLSRPVANAYARELLDAQGEDEDMMDVQASVAALARVPKIVEGLHRDAADRARDLTADFAARIAGLNDDRKDVYRRIEGLSTEPTQNLLQAPDDDVVNTKERVANGVGDDGEPDYTVTVLPTYDKHYLAVSDTERDDEDTDAPAPFSYPADPALNTWEKHVLDIEQGRHEHVGWYRNPSRGEGEALVIPWKDGTRVWRGLRPDFVFFSARADGTIGASIVDPHGHHLSDALPKLRGLADYAETHGDAFIRIISVAETKGAYRTLDMKSTRVRDAVREATDALSLYMDEDLSREYK